jgi:hypothetical protein
MIVAFSRQSRFPFLIHYELSLKYAQFLPSVLFGLYCLIADMIFNDSLAESIVLILSVVPLRESDVNASFMSR